MAPKAPTSATTAQPTGFKSVLADATADLLKFISFRSQGGEIDDVLKLLGSSAAAEIEKISFPLADLQTKETVLREIVLSNETPPKEKVESAAASTEKSQESKQVNVRTEDNTMQVVKIPDILSGSNLLNSLEIKNREDFHLLINNTGRSLNFSDRSSEYVAIFSNLIPAIELSKCVPYFNIRFIQETPNDNRTSMPFMTLDSFLGAQRAPTPGNQASVTPGGSLPYSRVISPLVSPGGMPDSTVSGMELFQTPQTVSTAGINTIAAYKANRGTKALDPLQPLASIENIGLDVVGVSQYLMTTQVKVDLDIILHDKSRLAELSTLVSPTIFPTVKAEIEWGWIHPDQSKFSTNAYAKFINALRSKQLFQVVNSSMSNKDSNSVGIKLQLVSLGDSGAKAVSIYTSNYVPYEMVRAKLQSIFRVMTMPATKSPDGTTIPAQHVIGYEQPVSLSTWEPGDKFVKYEDFQAIKGLLEGFSTGKSKITDVIKKYEEILTKLVQGETAKALADTLQKNMISALQSQKFEISPHVTKPWGEVNEKTAIGRLLSSIKDTVERDAGVGKDQAPTFDMMTLGDAIYFLYTQPLMISGLFDEVRVIFFDFNDHAGLYGSLNISSYILRTDEVIKEIVKPKMSTQSALTNLLRIAGNPAAAQYGVKAAFDEKVKAEEKAAEDVSVTIEEREEIQDAFEVKLAEIYKAKQGLHNVSYEPKFVPPRLKIHPEVVEVKSEELGGKTKNVLVTFIYDEANTGKRSANVALAAAQTPTATLRLCNGSDDLKNAVGVKLEQNTKSKTTQFTVTMDRNKVKSILQTAYPTIKLGSEGSTVTNATYSAGGNKMLTDINLIKGLKNSGGASRADTSAGIDADIFVVPTSLTLTMIGMPLVNRGQNFYVDFGTGTTIDNVYTVMGVKHSIKAGQFTSTVSLSLTMQGSIRSVVSNIQTDLAQVKKYYDSQLNAPQPEPGAPLTGGQVIVT